MKILGFSPAQVQFRGEGERGAGLNWRRELNLREAQIIALEREVANLRAQSRAARSSTISKEDDYRL